MDPFITAADPSVVATLRCYRGGSWGGTGDQYNFGSGIHYAGGTYTSASYQIGFRLALTLPE